jgi:hypothetical protein
MASKKEPKIGLHRDGNHRYSWNGSQKTVGVTTVVGVLDKSAKLTNWFAEQTADYAIKYINQLAALVNGGSPDLARDQMMAAAPAERDRSADRGDRVHQFAENLGLLQLGLPLRDIPELEEGDRPRAEQFLMWMDQAKPRFIAVEYMVFNEEINYGGTGDAMAYMPPCGEHGDECLWSIDYKTGNHIYNTTALQLAALAEGFIGLPDDPTQYPIPVANHYGVLHVTDTDAILHPFNVGEREWEVFKYLRSIHQWNLDTDRRKKSNQPQASPTSGPPTATTADSPSSVPSLTPTTGSSSLPVSTSLGQFASSSPPKLRPITMPTTTKTTSET